MAQVSRQFDPGVDPYPLTAEWLADPRVCPRIVGFDDFRDGVVWAAEKLDAVGFVAFRYGCLSAFDVSIHSYDHVAGGRPASVADNGAFWQVSVGCGSYGGSCPQPIRHADPYYVGQKLNLLEDDAKAVAYVLRQIGRCVHDLRVEA